MGQAESALVPLSDNSPVFDEDISIRRRRRRHQRNRGVKASAHFSSMYESGIDIDNVLNNLGLTSSTEETPLSGNKHSDGINTRFFNV